MYRRVDFQKHAFAAFVYMDGQVPGAFEDLLDAKRILREIRLLQHFQHDNIICKSGGSQNSWHALLQMHYVLESAIFC